MSYTSKLKHGYVHDFCIVWEYEFINHKIDNEVINKRVTFYLKKGKWITEDTDNKKVHDIHRLNMIHQDIKNKHENFVYSLYRYEKKPLFIGMDKIFNECPEKIDEYKEVIKNFIENKFKTHSLMLMNSSVIYNKLSEENVFSVEDMSRNRCVVENEYSTYNLESNDNPEHGWDLKIENMLLDEHTIMQDEFLFMWVDNGRLEYARSF